MHIAASRTRSPILSRLSLCRGAVLRLNIQRRKLRWTVCAHTVDTCTQKALSHSELQSPDVGEDFVILPWV